MKFRALVSMLAVAAGFLGVSAEDPEAPATMVEFELIEATISDIQSAVAAGALTYESLVGMYFDRIAEYDDEMNSVMRVNPSAVADAKALDLERQESGIRGPLHGIPILLKDLIDQEGDPTTGGSIAMKDCFPVDDSTVVSKLEEAGAIILGKVAMSEFALSYGRLGYSSLGGTVLNPYNFNRSSSGSSSGSASAVAANFATLALGSDTAGSIRGPAMSGALVGIKPTSGLVSLDGVIPLSPWADVVGPMARTVTDAAIALGALTGVDPADNKTLASEGNSLDDYTSALEVGAMSGITVGHIVGFSGFNDEVDAFFAQALADIEELGATIVDVNFTEFISDMEILNGFISGWSVLGGILEYECLEPLEDYLAAAGTGCPANVAELVNVSYAYSDTPTAWNPSRLDGLKACLDESPSMENEEYIRLIETVVPEMESTILGIMADLGVDVFAYPTMLCPARTTWYVDDPTWECGTGDQWVLDYIANIIGWPEIGVNMGITEANAPVGISFMSEKWTELELIGYAYDYEQATMLRQPPPGFEALEGEEFTYSSSAIAPEEHSSDASVNRVGFGGRT